MKSESVPDVETRSDAVNGPTSVRSCSKTAVSYTRTSGRDEAKRWSSVMYGRVIPVAIYHKFIRNYCPQSLPAIIRNYEGVNYLADVRHRLGRVADVLVKLIERGVLLGE